MDAELSRPDWLVTVQSGRKQMQSRVCTPSFRPVEIESSADNLVIVYKDDQEQRFGNELVQFVAFSNEFLKDADDNIGKEHFLYKLIIDKRVKCLFPNVEIALRMCELQW